MRQYYEKSSDSLIIMLLRGPLNAYRVRILKAALRYQHPNCRDIIPRVSIQLLPINSINLNNSKPQKRPTLHPHLQNPPPRSQEVLIILRHTILQTKHIAKQARIRKTISCVRWPEGRLMSSVEASYELYDCLDETAA